MGYAREALRQALVNLEAIPAPAGTLPVVLLATSSALPDGEEWTGTTHLTDAFTARGIDARWVVWDDPDVDWSEGLVAVRSTWDYETRLEEFLAWEDQEERKWEFDGTAPVATVGGTLEHAVIGGNVVAALRERLRGSPCR